MRLKASYLSTLHPKILDAGVTDWNAKPKKYSGQPIKIIKWTGIKENDITVIKGNERLRPGQSVSIK